MEEAVSKHVCGQCKDEWLSEAEYLAHQCPTTGFTPVQAENLGPDFVAIQEAALTRGKEAALAAGDEVQAARNDEAIQQLPTPTDEVAPSPEASPEPQIV